MVQQQIGSFLKNSTGDVVIELKGKNVEHAVMQVFATAQYWTNNGFVSGKLAGLIVCKRYPRASPSIQRAQDKFSKSFRGPLHIVTKNYEFKFKNVLSFKGPHKI